MGSRSFECECSNRERRGESDKEFSDARGMTIRVARQGFIHERQATKGETQGFRNALAFQNLVCLLLLLAAHV